MHTAIGETVLDPFLGSGTTLKMCQIASRKGIGYEINSDYAELIKTRILEEWKPATIQTQYKVFGTTQFFRILKFIDQRLKEDPLITLESLMEELHKHFPEKITKSWIGHLKRLKEESHDKVKTSQKMVLDKFTAT